MLICRLHIYDIGLLFYCRQRVNEKMEDVFRRRSDLDTYARTFENNNLDNDHVTRGFLYGSFLAAGGSYVKQQTV